MPSPSSRSRRARPLLGTLVEITAEGEGPIAQIDTAIDVAFARIAEVHACMSAHEADSDLAAVHAVAPGAVVSVSPHTITVLRAALQFARQSNGAFNPCLGGAMARLGHVPGNEGPYSTDFSALEIIDECSLRRHAALRLDLGGIAKGYAVDLAIEHLQAAGLSAGVVNAGGDLCCFGVSQSVGLRDPKQTQQVAKTIALHNRAMATSAPYFSQHLGASALYDPQQQRPRTGAFSISVLARACMTADALTKVVLNAPPTLVAQVLAQHQAEAFWLGVPDAA